MTEPIEVKEHATPIAAADVFAPGTRLGNSVYVCEKELGSGTFGTAFLCKDDKGQFVVVKRFKKAAFDTEFELQAVTAVAARVPANRNVCKFIELVVDPGNDKFSKGLAVVFEYCPGGSLEEILVARQAEAKRLTESELLNIARQLVDGLSALRAAGIVHRDIAARNIFLSDNFQLKIGDFGQAKYIGDGKTQTDVGAGASVAVEAKTGQPYDLRVDIFSLGVLLFELMTLRECKDSKAAVQALACSEELHERYPVLLPMVAAMMREKPEDRIELAALRAQLSICGE